MVLLLLGLGLAAGVLLWWQGGTAGSRLEWQGTEVASAGTMAGAGAPADADGNGEVGGETVSEGPVEIVVHVAGAVVRPGVYTLPAGSRMIDAVNAAGGPAAGADPNAVNLARAVADGERVYVPTREEVRKFGQAVGGSADGTGVFGGSAAGAGPGGTGTNGGTWAASGGSGADGLTSGPININTATQAQLDSLPGIGPTLALRIIQYRAKNGPFTSPEELLRVPGIGEKKLAELQPFITVR